MRADTPRPTRGQPYRKLMPPESAWKPEDPASFSWALMIGCIMIVWGFISSATAAGSEHWLWIIAGALLAWYGYANRTDRDAPSKDKDPAGYRAWMAQRIQAALAEACTPRPPARGFESKSERMMWEALKHARIAVHEQQTVANGYRRGYEYCADIAYYDQSCGLRIDIEIDGEFKDDNPDLQAKMARRDQWFTSHGWHVLRFHAVDAFSNSHQCAEFIASYIAVATRTHADIVRTWLPPIPSVVTAVPGSKTYSSGAASRPTSSVPPPWAKQPAALSDSEVDDQPISKDRRTENRATSGSVGVQRQRPRSTYEVADICGSCGRAIAFDGRCGCS